MIERDALAVGRPLEAADGERTARQRPCRARRDVDREQVRHPIVLFDHLVLAVLLLAILDGGLRLRRRVRDAPAIRRPGKPVHTLLDARQRVGFSRLRINQVDLTFVRSVRDERQLRAVWRPCRRLTRLLRVGELTRRGCRRARGRVGQPDLRFVRVLVPVGLANGIRDPAPVGRDFRRFHALQRQDLVDGRRDLRRRNRRCLRDEQPVVGVKHRGSADDRPREQECLFHLWLPVPKSRVPKSPVPSPQESAERSEV